MAPTIQWNYRRSSTLEFNLKPQSTEACYYYQIDEINGESLLDNPYEGDEFFLDVLLGASIDDNDIEVDLSTQIHVTKFDCSTSSTISDCYHVFVYQECSPLVDPTVLESEIETSFEQVRFCPFLRGIVSDQEETWNGELLLFAGSSQKTEIEKRWGGSFDE